VIAVSIQRSLRMDKGRESPRAKSGKPEGTDGRRKSDFCQWHEGAAGRLGLEEDEPRERTHNENGRDGSRSLILDSTRAAQDSTSTFMAGIDSDIPSISFERCLQIRNDAFSSTTIDSQSRIDEEKETCRIVTEIKDSRVADVTSIESQDFLDTKGSPCLTQKQEASATQGHDGAAQGKLFSAKGNPRKDEDLLPRKGSFRGLIPRRNSFLGLISEKQAGKECLLPRKGSLLSILNRRGPNTVSGYDDDHCNDSKSASTIHVVSDPLRRLSHGLLTSEETRGGIQTTKKVLSGNSPHSEHVLAHSNRRDLSSGTFPREEVSRARGSLLSGTPLTYSPSQRSPKSRMADKSRADAFSITTTPSLSSFTHGPNGEAVDEEQIARRIIEMQKQLDKLF
jgi:hypothetical protein